MRHNTIHGEYNLLINGVTNTLSKVLLAGGSIVLEHSGQN